MSLQFIEERPPFDFLALGNGEFVRAKRVLTDSRQSDVVLFRMPGVPDNNPDVIVFDGAHMTVCSASEAQRLFVITQTKLTWSGNFKGEVRA